MGVLKLIIHKLKNYSLCVVKETIQYFNYYIINEMVYNDIWLNIIIIVFTIMSMWLNLSYAFLIYLS